MKYTEEMILHSSSGYCMPFEEQKGKEVEMLFGYGNQKKEDSDETYFNHGIDFKAKNYLLSSMSETNVCIRLSAMVTMRSHTHRWLLYSPISVNGLRLVIL